MATVHDLTTGRVVAVTFEHGEDFFTGLETACRAAGITTGYIPMFIAGLSAVELVGTCEKVADPEAPVWSRVHLDRVEAVGAGTIALDSETGEFAPHIHASVGLKQHSAVGYTSHLLAATVQFLVEMVVVEVVAPTFMRQRQPQMYNVPLLRLG